MTDKDEIEHRDGTVTQAGADGCAADIDGRNSNQGIVCNQLDRTADGHRDDRKLFLSLRLQNRVGNALHGDEDNCRSEQCQCRRCDQHILGLLIVQKVHNGLRQNSQPHRTRQGEQGRQAEGAFGQARSLLAVAPGQRRADGGQDARTDTDNDGLRKVEKLDRHAVGSVQRSRLGRGHAGFLQPAHNKKGVNQIGQAQNAGAECNGNGDGKQRAGQLFAAAAFIGQTVDGNITAPDIAYTHNDDVNRAQNRTNGDAADGACHDNVQAVSAVHQVIGQPQAENQFAQSLNDLGPRCGHHVGQALIIAADGRNQRHEENTGRNGQNGKAC